MNPRGKPLVPPFSSEARVEAGYLLRLVQLGHPLSMPHSRPMPVVGQRCHELRIKDKHNEWRIVYRVDKDAIVIAEVFGKTTRTTPAHVLVDCKRRLGLYDGTK